MNQNNLLKIEENEQDFQSQKHFYELLENTVGSMKTYYNKRLKGKDSVPEIGRGTSSMNSKKPLENNDVAPNYGDILIKMEDEDPKAENEKLSKDQSSINNSDTLKSINDDYDERVKEKVLKIKKENNQIIKIEINDSKEEIKTLEEYYEKY